MKKHLLLIVSLFVVGNASAYSFKVKNHTKEKIHVLVEYGGEGVCSPDSKSLVGWTTRTISTGACCLKKVEVKKTSGTNTGTKYTFYPSRTGFGISCRSDKMKVTENPDGSLNLERY